MKDQSKRNYSFLNISILWYFLHMPFTHSVYSIQSPCSFYFFFLHKEIETEKAVKIKKLDIDNYIILENILSSSLNLNISLSLGRFLIMSVMPLNSLHLTSWSYTGWTKIYEQNNDNDNVQHGT